MTDPIRESVAKRLYPDAWYFAGSDEDKCAALAKADYAIRAVTGALEAQGLVVVPRPPTAEEREQALEDFARWLDEIAPECTECARKAFGDLLPAASNKETGL